ncbi:MAG: phosphoribosylformylglycinamidine synthase [Christensenellales bacterium]
MVYRVYVEKKDNNNAASLIKELNEVVGIKPDRLRILLRYDVEGITKEEFEAAVANVFSEAPVDEVYIGDVKLGGNVFAVGLLDGQYDQRADSAAQCIQLLTQKDKPLVKVATVYAISGISESGIEKIKKYLINPVEAKQVGLEKYETLKREKLDTVDVSEVKGFIRMSKSGIAKYHKKNGFAMSIDDLIFVQKYFKKKHRNPTETEIKVIDTYWSDHCRHTTFLTELKKVEIKSENGKIGEAYELYKNTFKDLYKAKPDKYPCLMDLATIAVKELKRNGKLDALDESDEINACSIIVPMTIGNKTEDWLVMFKNETHNHPTEIEPFGGAATCLGGAIRDPLSGRTYVYNAMRITGAADPLEKDVLKGKLPQRVLTKVAAKGFSSYGNQIGLATGIVDEVYHEGYKAKRLETGFVVGSNKRENIIRYCPKSGDLIILLGGETGRDGCGGATGSSKAHDSKSVETCGAEVQKGNALVERKLQRLFLNDEATKMIKRCNDFGAGGVCVAIGELADSLEIDLDKVPIKYEGLTGTELAISESQERMAICISPNDKDRFIQLAKAENLQATVVAKVTDDGRMKMTFKGKTIVDIEREFLNTNGVRQEATATINDKTTNFFNRKLVSFKEGLISALSDLNVCCKKGLSETFDSTIGSRTVYMPFGGKNQLTPSIAIGALVAPTDDCKTASVAGWGYSPYLMESSPFVGAIYSIICSVSKLIACGCELNKTYLTLQEYFMKLGNSSERWGVPVSALMGAFYTQMGLGIGAIGGKDSMSGSFENIDVPPTLISFALATQNVDRLITNVVKEKGQKLFFIPFKKDKNFVPDFANVKEVYNAVANGIKDKKINFATVVENGGIAATVVKSCLGNGLGFNFVYGDLFTEHYGEIIISCDNPSELGLDGILIGETTDGGFVSGGQVLTIEEATNAFVNKLDSIYPVKTAETGKAENVSYKAKSVYVSNVKAAKPKVFIPAFPGTNCELDTMRRFTAAGAEAEIFVVKNLTSSDVEESVEEIVKRIKKANIIAFPGGFSGGDEPDGSGKFIATTFRNPKIKEAVIELLSKRDGLAIGICNGFQALIKLGLVPFGEIVPMTKDSPTLTFNTMPRHVSTMVNIRVASNKSPWFNAVKVGDVFSVAVSHGEGKFVANDDVISTLVSNGQIATQYVDFSGNATMESPFNPNGSKMAIEGITSLDGRVLGKMGHSERIGKDLYKNYDGNFDMKIFESGVKYFK